MKCKAKSKRTGKACGNNAILGGAVCRMHGGSAPQVKLAALRRLQAADITPERTILEVAQIAYGRISSLYDDDGNPRPFSELTDDQKALLAATETVIKNAEAGDGHTDRVLKLKAWDRTKALEMLMKHFGLLQEKIEHSGGIDISWQE